jgi:hypothetical protein
MMTNLIGEAGNESDNDSSTVSTDICESVSEAPLAEEHVSEAQERINASLVEACARGDFVAIKAHLDAGGSPNIRLGHNQEVALIQAARYGHSDIAQLLLNSDANPDIQNTYHQTALMWAVKEGHNDIAELLLDNGAGLTIQNDNDETALLWAAEAANIAGIKLLVAKGVNIVKDGKIFIADMMGDNFYSSATSQLRDYFKSHMTELGAIADQMIAKTMDKNYYYMVSQSSKYSRTDMLSILANKLGDADMRRAVEIYDQAMNDATVAEEDFARPPKKARR